MSTFLNTLTPGVFDAVGVAGFGLYVLNYTLLTFRKIRTDRISYFVINGIAAAMVLIGLTSSFNLASAMIQIFWVGTSLVAIILRLRSPAGATPHSR